MVKTFVLAATMSALAASAQAQTGGVGGILPYSLNNPSVATDSGAIANPDPNKVRPGQTPDPNASTGGPCYGVWGGCAGGERTQQHHGR